MYANPTRYYWEFAKELGLECLHISRSDMLASILTSGFVFLINRNALDLKTAVQAAILTLVSIGILHLFKIPWLLVRRASSKEPPLASGWGVLGVAFFLGFAACVFFTAAWLYTMQPSVEFLLSPDGKDRRIAEIETELAICRVPESQNSLRRRTIVLVSHLNTFWSQRPVPQQQPVSNPSSDEERQRNAKWDRYWQDAKAAYDNSNYRERVLGVVREYKAKGVATGWLEQSAEQPERLIGASPYGGWNLENCTVSMSDLCQLRELAYHVDAQDRPIFLSAKPQ